MSQLGDIELLQADVQHYHDQVALLRAEQYRWGLRPSPELRELEGKLERAEQRLREATDGHGTSG